MGDGYTATARQNPGRKSWLVEFRHPLKNDANNRPGKKIRKGLGAVTEPEARRLAAQLEEILGDKSLWSVGAQPEAAKRGYDARVLEIFYDEVQPRVFSARDIRNVLLPLPDQSEGYGRVLLLGVPGAGKTTLVRQLIGTNPDTERFPSTSINRTTTFVTEVALRPGPYECVVTFMSEHEARFEIEEAVSAAIVDAITENRAQAARSFLEKSDMRFRLKYVLGDLADENAPEDPYEDPAASEDSLDEALTRTAADDAALSVTLTDYVDRIVSIASSHRATLEAGHGLLASLSADDRGAALDIIEKEATGSDEFVALVSDVLDELRTRFDAVEEGRFEKTTTGWPKAWYVKNPPEQRGAFFRAVRRFSGISHRSWGKLLTPLVNGIRVAGPFKPSWGDSVPLVVVDTEGLGHKADANADLPDQTLLLMHEANSIVLVESAKSGLTNFAAGKALESIVNAGHTKKLAVVFTHMDVAKGENLKGQSKFDHIFAGVRNVADNQVAKNVSVDAARYLVEQLRRATFYVGRIDALDPKPAVPELRRFLAHLAAALPEVTEPVAFPEYSTDNLVFAIQEAIREFRMQWQAYLGLSTHPEHKARPWQTIKAMSRRYAEGWDDGFWLRPTSNLVAAMSAAISRFLETPVGWSGNPTPEQQRDVIDRIKAAVTQQLPVLSGHRLRELPQPEWNEAYSLRGGGSTFDRRMRIESIYERWTPIPDARGNRLVAELLGELKQVVLDAIGAIEKQVTAAEAMTVVTGASPAER